MTDDYRKDLELSLNPRPYHFFKVKFTVFNKVSCQYSSRDYYISTKYSKNWLDKLMCGYVYLPLPREHFEYKWELFEVEDSDDILFHHIRNKESWEFLSVSQFLDIAAYSDWHISFRMRFSRFLKKLKKNFHKYSVKVVFTS